MPLSVEIKINGREIETVWIGRTERLTGTEDVHTYACGVGTPYLEPWNVPSVRIEDLPTFEHRYSDGARVCALKALEALEMFDKELGT